MPMDLDIVDVEQLLVQELEDLFEWERRAWRERLGWDPASSAGSMARAVPWGAVRGAVLRRAGRATAYCVHQPAPSLTRTCGVHLPPRDAHAALPLVTAALSSVPRGVRVEGQLAAFETQPALDSAFRSLGFAVEPREFVAVDGPLAEGSQLRSSARLEPLRKADLPGCARVLVEAHAGGVEASINQAFRTEAAALGYLRELVELAGCGRVDPVASVVARQQGGVAGFCVASSTAAGVGHVPQIAVAPAAQGRGLGAFLLGSAIERLRERGCRRITLSVSSANARASAWYRRVGFRPLTVFASYHRDGRPEL